VSVPGEERGGGCRILFIDCIVGQAGAIELKASLERAHG